MRSRKAAAFVLSLLPLPLAAQAQAGAIDWAHADSLQVTMRDYRFLPNRLVLRRGVPYRLRLVNRSSDEWHEFTAPEFLKSAVLADPKILDAAHSELAVPPGAARDLYLVPRTAGQYRFYCSDHDWAGMEGKITVK